MFALICQRILINPLKWQVGIFAGGSPEIVNAPRGFTVSELGRQGDVAADRDARTPKPILQLYRRQRNGLEFGKGTLRQIDHGVGGR